MSTLKVSPTTASGVPPRDEWPSHLHRRPGSKNFYARVRVAPGAGLRKSHEMESLRTARYAEAVKRLPVVVGQLRAKIEAARREATGALKESARDTPASDAAWWQAKIRAHGADPSHGIPDELRHEWEAWLESRLGQVVGECPVPGGDVEPIHQGDDEVGRIVALVFETVLPVEAELDRFLRERDVSPRYALRHRRATRLLREWLVARSGSDDLRRVSRREAGLFGDHLAGGRATQTVNSLLSSLSAYWDWLGKRVGVEGNPWQGQQRQERRDEVVANKRPFSDDEVRRLLSGDTYSTLHDLMRVAALSGMRISEIARLTVADAADGVFQVREGKTDAAERIVPVHPDLVTLVSRRARDKAPAARLFDELRAPASRLKELSAKASEAFTRYRRQLGIDDRRPGQRQADADFHSFRRWFITKAEQAGALPHVLSSVVGHAEGRKGMTLGTYSAGPSVEQRRRVVEAVRLPEGALVESPTAPLMGARRRPREAPPSP